MRLPIQSSSLSPSSSFTLLQGLSSCWLSSLPIQQQEYSYHNISHQRHPFLVRYYEDLLDPNLRALFLCSNDDGHGYDHGYGYGDMNDSDERDHDHDGGNDPFGDLVISQLLSSSLQTQQPTTATTTIAVHLSIGLQQVCGGPATSFEADILTRPYLHHLLDDILQPPQQQTITSSLWRQQPQKEPSQDIQKQQQQLVQQPGSSVNNNNKQEEAAKTKAKRRQRNKPNNNKSHSRAASVVVHKNTNSNKKTTMQKTRKVPRRTLLSNITDYERDLEDDLFAELIEQVRLPTFTLEEYYETDEEEEDVLVAEKEERTAAATTTETSGSSSIGYVTDDDAEEESDDEVYLKELLKEQEETVVSTMTQHQSPLVIASAVIKWKLLFPPPPSSFFFSTTTATSSRRRRKLMPSSLSLSYAAFRKRPQRQQQPQQRIHTTTTKPPLPFRVETIFLVDIPQCPLDMLQVVPVDAVSQKRRVRQRRRDPPSLPPPPLLPPPSPEGVDDVSILVESFWYVPYPHCNVGDLQLLPLDVLHLQKKKKKKHQERILRIQLATPMCALEDLKVQPLDRVCLVRNEKQHSRSTTTPSSSSPFSFFSSRSHTARRLRHYVSSRLFSGWLPSSRDSAAAALEKQQRPSFSSLQSSSVPVSLVVLLETAATSRAAVAATTLMDAVDDIQEALLRQAPESVKRGEEAEDDEHQTLAQQATEQSSSSFLLLQEQESQDECYIHEDASIITMTDTMPWTPPPPPLPPMPILHQQQQHHEKYDGVTLGVLNDNDAPMMATAAATTTAEAWPPPPPPPRPLPREPQTLGSTADSSNQMHIMKEEWNEFAASQEQWGPWNADADHVVETGVDPPPPYQPLPPQHHTSASSAEIPPVEEDGHRAATDYWRGDASAAVAAAAAAESASVVAPDTAAACEQDFAASSGPLEKDDNRPKSGSEAVHWGNDVDALQQPHVNSWSTPSTTTSDADSSDTFVPVDDPFASVLNENPEHDVSSPSYGDENTNHEQGFYQGSYNIPLDGHYYTSESEILFHSPPPPSPPTSTAGSGGICSNPEIATTNTEQRLWRDAVEEVSSDYMLEQEPDLCAIPVDLERELAAMREDLEHELAAIQARLNMLRQEQLMLQMDECSDGEDEEFLDEKDLAILRQGCDRNVVVMDNDLVDELEELTSKEDGAELLWHLWRDPDESDELLDAEIQLLRESTLSSTLGRPATSPRGSSRGRRRNDVMPTRTRQ